MKWGRSFGALKLPLSAYQAQADAMDQETAESLHRQLQEIIASTPDLSDKGLMKQAEGLQWLGRAAALVERVGDGFDAMAFRLAADKLGFTTWDPTAIRTLLYRSLARAEALAPTSARGAFIPTGAPFDVFAILSKVLGAAQRDVLIVDPYLDSTVLTDFAGLVPAGVQLRLLSDAQYVKLALQLKPAVARWITQYGQTRPLEARQSPPGALHDRLILLDDTQAWSLSQSLKDFAKRAHGSVSRLEPEITALKFAAYGSTWSAAAQL